MAPVVRTGDRPRRSEGAVAGDGLDGGPSPEDLTEMVPGRTALVADPQEPSWRAGAQPPRWSPTRTPFGSHWSVALLLVPALLLLSLALAPSAAAAEPADWPTEWADTQWSRVQETPGNTTLSDLGIANRIDIHAVSGLDLSEFVHASYTDLDDDGGIEMVSSWISSIVVLEDLQAGTPTVVWERAFEGVPFGMSAFAIGDLTGDGSPEIVTTTTGGSDLFVLDGLTGEILLRNDLNGHKTPVQSLILDLDDSGRQELVYASGSRHVVAARMERSPDSGILPGQGSDGNWTLEEMWRVSFPVENKGETAVTWPLLLGDVTGDGEGEILAGSLLDPDGAPAEVVAVRQGGDVVWRTRLQVASAAPRTVGNFLPGEGREVVLRYLQRPGSEAPTNYLILTSEGEVACHLGRGVSLFDGGVAVDLDGDTLDEYLMADYEAHRFVPREYPEAEGRAVLAWNGCQATPFANPLAGHPQGDLGQTPRGNQVRFGEQPVAGDLDGDGAWEVLFPRWTAHSDELLLYNETGFRLDSFALPPPARQKVNHMAVVDLDGDGVLTPVATTEAGIVHVLGHTPDIQLGVVDPGGSDGEDGFRVRVRVSGPDPPDVVELGVAPGRGEDWARRVNVTLANRSATVDVGALEPGAVVMADPGNAVWESNESNNRVVVAGESASLVASDAWVAGVGMLVAAVAVRWGRRA